MNESSTERVNREMNAEIQIRGRFITMSCDLENTLLNIMAYSAPDPSNQIRRFKNMMMHENLGYFIWQSIKSHLPSMKEWKKKMMMMMVKSSYETAKYFASTTADDDIEKKKPPFGGLAILVICL